MGIKRFAVLSSLAVLGLCSVKAQNDVVPYGENCFRRGEILVSEGNFHAAEIELEKALKLTENSADKEKIEYLIIKSRFRTNKLSTTDVESFLSEYPYTPYKNELYYIAGKNELGKDMEKSFGYLSRCDMFSLSDSDCEEGIYAFAVAAMETGRDDTARLNFMTLKEVSGKYRNDAIYNIAYIYYRNGDMQKAFDSFTLLQDDFLYGTGARRYMTDILYVQGKYDDAVEMADVIIDGCAGGCDYLYEIYRIKGQALYKQKKYNEAINELEYYAGNVSEPSRQAIYMLGMSYFNVSAYKKAADVLERVTDMDDELAQNAYLHIGIANIEMNDKDKARLAFAHASASNLNEEVMLQALYNYALCIHETSYSPFNESVTVFERLLNEYPDTRYAFMASRYMADAYLATTSYDAALESIEKIKNPDSEIIEAKQIILMRYGIANFAKGNYEEAFDLFSRSIALGQYNREAKADALFWRGETSYRTGNYTNAEKDFIMYTELEDNRKDETYAMAFYNLGYINFRKKSYGKALSYFRRCEAVASSLTSKVMSDMANRMGDCYYHSRNFDEAEKYYALAASKDPSQGDYAMFQRSFIMGLQKNYDAKIRQIDQMIARYPESVYCDDAMFEKGRAYVLSGNNMKAISTYDELIADYPASRYVCRAELEKALLYYQDGEYAKAEISYKNVINKYPGTSEAWQAKSDLKNLYVDQNRVDQYFDYMASIGQNSSEESAEKDSLTYIAAERLYIGGDTGKGAGAMAEYIDKFPKGMFYINANYYTGLYKYNSKLYKEAIPYLEQVNNVEANQYAEEALLMLADSYYEISMYEKAFECYSHLRDMASMDERKIMAETGMMRCAAKSDDYQNTVKAAKLLVSHSKADPQLIIEAHYLSAKAYAAMSDKDSALQEWKTISDDTGNEFGAEAKFRVAEYYFSLSDYSEAEKVIMDYIEKGTPYAYWMARSFVLQSDIYAAQGKYIDARQFLLSLKQNYKADDDIKEMIESRLESLKKK